MARNIPGISLRLNDRLHQRFSRCQVLCVRDRGAIEVADNELQLAG